MKNRVALYDIIFFLVFPLVVWNYGRDMIGDYYAMLLSSAPGIIYSVFRFVALKQFNVFGIFMLVNLVVGALVDVLAGSAIQLLWNNVYYAYTLGAVFFLTIIIKKPIALYFALDIVELQGQNRQHMKPLFMKKKLFSIFQLITLGFVIRDIVLASIKVWLILRYGVDAFDKGIILRQALNWAFSAVFVLGFLYVAKAAQEVAPDSEQALEESN
ncbi:VC0807 family protein [Ectobacillus panaciterrae]|uniref:VC0807 family protein n=1 Tax=Ectobacillus panaciterrae TaxID=363872 RepID=UPI00041A3093|nr:VC0807 family protein [Ectobacillus panaciterrae]